MAKALKTVAVIAGAVALVATGVGAIGGAFGLSAAGAATASSVATYASIAAGVASLGANLLTKGPRAQGSINRVLISADAPAPYLIGETFFGGVLRYDRGYGGSNNPYRAMTFVHSVAGPVQSFDGLYADFESVPLSSGIATGYFNAYLWADTQLGETPETSALAAHHSGTPNWTSSHKLSGKAAVLINTRFSKKGERFASGLPSFGCKWHGVKVYDPRQDASYPGGSGSHSYADWNDKSAYLTAKASWTYDANPGTQALNYALGRWDGSSATSDPLQRVAGLGIPLDGLIVEDFVELANVCDANGWTANGVVLEPALHDDPKKRWNNFLSILDAGGARPAWRGGKLGLIIQAPRLPIATVRADDLADAAVEFDPVQSWRERRNTLVPKYLSGAHNWEYVPAEAVGFTDLIAEDGEEKLAERQFNLVTGVNQVSQLAAYVILQSREAGPIRLTLKPEWRFYGPGDMLRVDIPEEELQFDAVIVRRTIDPVTLTVSFEMEGETAGKHAKALNLTGTTTALGSSNSLADRDATAAFNFGLLTSEATVLSLSYPSGLTITGTDAGSDATVTTTAHNRVYTDGSVSVDAGSVTGLDFETLYYLYYDDESRAGGAITLAATETAADAFVSSTNPNRHYVGSVTTPADEAADTTGYPAQPPTFNIPF